MAFAMAEAIGLAAALFPRAWLTLFGNDPAMLDAGTQYLRAVGPFYGFFGVGLVLYFASQGAGRLLWPVIGNLARLAVAALGGWLALRWSGELAHVFVGAGRGAGGLRRRHRLRPSRAAPGSGRWAGRAARPGCCGGSGTPDSLSSLSFFGASP